MNIIDFDKIQKKPKVGHFDPVREVYVMHNGVKFKTIEEVNAFIKGLEFAKSNANIGLDMVIENSLNSLKDMDI